MTEEFLELALSMSSAQLDHDRRPWIVGVGHLMGTPFSEEFSEETFKSALNIAMTTTEFPSGPVRYMPETYVQEVGEDYRLVRVASAAAPHLELQIGLGGAGVVALGLTRTDILDDGSTLRGAVTLSDVESMIADTVTLSIAAALELGYTGHFEYCTAIAYSRPDGTLTFLAIDEETGQMTTTREGVAEFEPVFSDFEFSSQTTPRQVHEFIYSVATRAAEQFEGTPQLTTLHDEGHSDYTQDPLKGEGRR